MEEKDPNDKPIPGPAPVGPEYIFERDWERPLSGTQAFGRRLLDLVRDPAHWVRENIVEPNRGPKYYWYHRKYNRALPIDECYMDDLSCIYEADMEYKRGYMVDRATLDLLRMRRDSCLFWHYGEGGIPRPSENCQHLVDTYNREELNFFIKYGDMHWQASVLHAYNKQKHRMIMERRQVIKEDREGQPEARA